MLEDTTKCLFLFSAQYADRYARQDIIRAYEENNAA